MASRFYDRVTVERSDDSDFVTYYGEVGSYGSIDRVTVTLPRKGRLLISQPGRGPVQPAVVNWSAMGDRSPEHAAAYAALIARAARFAAKKNAELAR